MNKKVLIINSLPSTSETVFWPLLDGLRLKGAEFRLVSRDPVWRKNFQEKKWPTHKLLLIWSEKTAKSNLLFLLLFPIYSFLALGSLVYFRTGKKIDTLLCLNLPEKIIYTPWAKLLKMKIIWVECLLPNERKNIRLMDWLYRIMAKRLEIIAFGGATKSHLERLGITKTPVVVLKPGVNLNQFRRQENIFDRMAAGEPKSQQHKFFTIGAIVRPGEPYNIEMLFQAAKKCALVIRNLQVIVVTTEEGKKDLLWLARKLEIDGLVWLVGERPNLSKWLDSFDVFVATALNFNMSEMNLGLEVMAAALPIVGERHSGWEDLVDDQKNGLLIEKDSSEALAQALIKLEQNPRWRALLGEQSKKIIMSDYSLARAADAWSQIIN